MKKALSLLVALLVTTVCADAKDYAKMHMKQMQKNQEYRIDQTYYATYAPKEKSISYEIKDPKLIKLNGYKDLPVEKLRQKNAQDNDIICMHCLTDSSYLDRKQVLNTVA